MDTIPEPAKRIPVYGEYDVVVAGGGVAGVSAALSARRSGAKRVLLIEKQFAVGGLATLGLVAIYLPLCDGRGRQVSFGIAEELLRLSIKHGAESDAPTAWLNKNSRVDEHIKSRYEVQFNPPCFAIEMEQLLINAGVEILYGAAVCGADITGSRINALFLECKEGRRAVLCGSAVDATGDADVCYISNENTAVSRMGNFPAAWYYSIRDGENKLKMLGFSDDPGVNIPSNKKSQISKLRFAGLDSRGLTDMTLISHRASLRDYLKTPGAVTGRSLTSISSIPQVRMTRRVEGVYTMDISEEFTAFDDSIGMIGNWRKRGPIYEIPFRALRGNKIVNLITAGRCISAKDDIWDLTRAIPACAVTGQAAGAAAAMTDDFSCIDIAALQKTLKNSGVKLHVH